MLRHFIKQGRLIAKLTSEATRDRGGTVLGTESDSRQARDNLDITLACSSFQEFRV